MRAAALQTLQSLFQPGSGMNVQLTGNIHYHRALAVCQPHFPAADLETHLFPSALARRAIGAPPLVWRAAGGVVCGPPPAL